MDSGSFTDEQLERLSHAVRKKHRYFEQLCGRMNQRHFPQSDPVKCEAEKVRESLKRLVEILDTLPTR